MKRFFLILWKCVAVLGAGTIILLALAVGIFRLMLPTVPEYREQIQAAASDFIGRPVTLGNIDARWRFGGPELTFTDTTVYTPDGAEVLAHADLASVGLSLLHYVRTRQLRPGRVTFEGVKVNILRTTDNRFFLSGRQVWPSSGGSAGDLPTGVFSLRDTSITYTDAALASGPRLFSQIDVDLELRKTGMHVEGSTELPDSLGGDIEFSAQAEGKLSEFANLSWQASVNGEAIKLGGWGSLLRDSLGRVTAGQGDVELRGRFRGASPRRLTATVDLKNLALTTSQATTAAYAGLAGRVEWEGLGAGWQAFARDISVERNGKRWTADSWQLDYGSTENDQVLYAAADFMRAQDIVPLAGLAPDTDWKQKLLALDLEGDLSDVELSSARSNAVQTRYALRGNFAGLGWAASESIPGVRGISAALRMDEQGGRLEIAPVGVELSLARLFEKSLSSKNVQGTVIWRRGTAGWRVLSDNLVFDTADFSSRTSFELQLPGNELPPNLDLHAYLSNVSIAGATGYLPSRVMKPKLTAWLSSALAGGTITEGEVSFAGPLASFPFDDGDGHFRADATFENLTMAYADGWPSAEDANGTIAFANASLDGNVSSGRILDTALTGVTVAIPDLRSSVIAIAGRSAGSFGDIVGYLNASPVGKAIGPTLARVEASGDATAEISLVLPIGRMHEREVNVDLALRDAAVGLSGIRQQLTEVDGFLRYRNAGITGEGVIGKLLGSTVTLDVAPEHTGAQVEPAAIFRDTATVVTVRGSVDAIELAREYPGSLASVLDGVTDYTARARFPVSRPGRPDFFRVEVDSTLTGMAIGLPAPLEKAGNAQWRMNATAGFPASDRLELRLERDEIDIAQLAFKHDGERWRLLRGAAAFGGGAVTLPQEQGIVLGGMVPFIDMSGWLNVGDGAESSFRVEDVLLAADLQTQSLRVFGQQFSDAAIVLDRSDREWLIQIEADRIQGAIFVPFDTPAGDAITARLDRLWLQGSPEDNGQYPDPRALPALVLNIEDFQFDEMHFGTLEASTKRSADGIVVESMLTRANSFSTEGSGAWTMDEGSHRSQVELLFTSTDVLETLASLDFEPSIDSSEAEVQLALNWPGPPGRHFREQLNGEVKVAVGNGQLQNVQPGAGRVFGLLSITELPRRLSLDFRDVFSTGFGFNAIRGDFTLTDGNAYTSNLVLDGPAAQVGIVGRAGIAARDYDQTAVVHASLGATLPVAGALAGGPAVGAALLIFSEIFKKPLQDMVRVNYRITGSWDDPQVNRVLDSELAASNEAAPAATNDEPLPEPEPELQP